MREIVLTKTGINKVKSNQKDLKSSDVESSIKSLSPGEWCIFKNPKDNEKYIGFVNPMVDDKFSTIYILKLITSSEINNFNPVTFLEERIQRALSRRKFFKDYEKGARIFYGQSDELNGLIADMYTNAVIVQINTAGLDKYRNEIKNIYEKISGRKVFLLDNQKYREKESLPFFEMEPLPDLEITESGLKFKLRSEVIQKVGYYYDHRENRSALKFILSKLNSNIKIGLDLFCYVGSWGISALASGLERVEFVDQGNFSREIEEALIGNGFKEKGSFYRADVFKFLDEKISAGFKYDLIMCDPPAFTKTASGRDQALDGYSKLHRKVIKVAKPGSLIVFSSCTHYVDHNDFQKNICDAAQKENKSLQLLFVGVQGWDHPISNINERSSYIKSYFYIME